MKKIQLLITIILFATTAFAQVSKEKWHGFVGKEKCNLIFTTTNQKGKPGFEESITYKGTLTIGAKRISVTGYFEGNTMRFMQMVNGKKTETLIFDLSSEEGTYKINGKTYKVQLSRK